MSVLNTNKMRFSYSPGNDKSFSFSHLQYNVKYEVLLTRLKKIGCAPVFNFFFVPCNN